MTDKQIVLVTGAGRGIGRAIAKRLASENRKLYLHYGQSAEGAEALRRELDVEGFEAETIRADLFDLDATTKLVKTIADKEGRFDILVNNAGITRDGLAVRMSNDDYDDVITVNQRAPFILMREAGKIMMRRRFGRIINIASVVGLTGNAGQINYAASKAALIAMSKSLAFELATRGVTVNCIAPGYIETEMTDVLSESVREAIMAQIPQKRAGSPEDIAAVAAFLASDDAAYITAQTISVDGGMLRG
ncbi:MAG TPA: 3-oxoacyl-[acyl-carrier-protein] reductase [Clostridiaceae bacterium]|nr:3-oxoacyl-[acyl-carrier-protein] reductase [Clostridiaceae bacterium]